MEVILTNKGFVTWKPQGNNPFRLSYHWLDQDAEKMLISEGLRTDLPRQVNQGESVLLHAQV